MSHNEEPLGKYLRKSRQASGLSLRAVEEATDRAVTNGYLSQIESGQVARPSPNILFSLASVYGIDYADLLLKAGHRVPRASVPRARGTVAGLPLRALQDLTDSERSELLDYIAYLRSKRRGSAGGE
jgi:transcriptional regulator with XRE-family HTH domain